MPETIKDVDTKIAYLEELKEIAKNSLNANDFKDKVKAKFPAYSGLNYLDMTAGYFFHKIRSRKDCFLAIIEK